MQLVMRRALTCSTTSSASTIRGDVTQRSGTSVRISSKKLK